MGLFICGFRSLLGFLGTCFFLFCLLVFFVCLIINGSYLFIFTEIKKSMMKASFRYCTVPSEFLTQTPEFLKSVYGLSTDLVRSINLSFLAVIFLLENRIKYIYFILMLYVWSDSFLLPNVLFLADFKASAATVRLSTA